MKTQNFLINTQIKLNIPQQTFQSCLILVSCIFAIYNIIFNLKEGSI